MAHERNISSKAFAVEEAPDRSFVLGQLLSRIFHPLLLNMFTLFFVGYATQAPRTTGLAWAGVCAAAQVLPITLFYTVRRRQGVFSDEDVSIRQQRNELYLFGMLSVIVTMAALLPFGLPRPFLALLTCGLALGLAGALINLYWKISIHASSIALTATIVLLFTPTLGIVLWLCAIVVGWARVRTRNHTPLQVLAGFALATLIGMTLFNGMV